MTWYDNLPVLKQVLCNCSHGYKIYDIIIGQ